MSSQPASSNDPHGSIDEHPEILVAGAFAGGLALAVVLKLLGGGDD